MSKVVVVGSFVVDLMARAPHLPGPAETVKGDFFQRGPGGKGFNQGVAAFKSGAEVTMVSKVGQDSLAAVALDHMRELKMSQEYMFVSPEVGTGVALIMVDEQTSQNQIVVVPGACNTITPAELASIEPLLKEAEFLLLQLEINPEVNAQVVELARELGVKVIMNTAPYAPVPDELLRQLWLVTPNEVEAEGLTGLKVDSEAKAREAAQLLKNRGIANVIITMGAQGVFVSTAEREAFIPAYEVEAIDSTGAGDAFNGGLLTALAEGKNLFAAAEFANATAALSVQKLGTTPSMPWRSEIDQFIAAQEG
ncbi:MAG: ribokinase [Eubacteriales bacterium]|nr:ribokinase [Eubacteriales bacterium]